jgi:rRNA maturation endonuclease Nob1
MLRCYNCNARVLYTENGWLCPSCGQHGRPDLIAKDWEHGREINAPYMEKKNGD